MADEENTTLPTQTPITEGAPTEQGSASIQETPVMSETSQPTMETVEPTPPENPTPDTPSTESTQEKVTEEIPQDIVPENKNVVIEKSGDTVTITEYMTPTKPSQKSLWMSFLDKLNIRKRRRLDKILQKMGERGKITNDEVEKLLHISHATATRYLDILEKDGEVRQVGKIGKYTYYEKI